MEKLDLLEQRIDALIKELGRLREENQKLQDEKAHLRDDLELAQMASDEVQEQLNSERDVRIQAVQRMDSLLDRIQAALPSAEQPSEQ
ncbi:cell division protein ZapB [uncultured Mailhella sp.]|uniref:cell division protein ZapB n=1 Tax=uncultured Mailhella sp. TaxID=1981031 RepID=UPI00261E3140|nr:cell division protein ZapB [uncultured Mailhella sp.]